MSIFTFWEGQMPEYIKMCLETWPFDYIKLNYENVGSFTDFDRSVLSRFGLPTIADYVRVHVLRDNGGYWLDADTIMLTDKLPEANLLGNPKTRTNTIGMLHFEKGTEMLKEWAEFQDERIRDASNWWSVLGNDFTDGYLMDHKEINIGEVRNCWPETYIIQGSLDRFSKYIRFYFERSYQLADIDNTDMLMLHNSWTPDWYKRMTRDEITKQNCTMSNVLLEALK